MRVLQNIKAVGEEAKAGIKKSVDILQEFVEHASCQRDEIKKGLFQKQSKFVLKLKDTNIRKSMTIGILHS
jgi:hypothetical protein